MTAGAHTIRVSVTEDKAAGRLCIEVDDDGPGLPVTFDRALDPFFTTKRGKRTGLGLSLYHATAERAGGGLELARSDLGGLAVRAWFRLGHVDLPPLGDLPGTFSAMIMSHPDREWICRLRAGALEREARLSVVRNELPVEDRDGPSAALQFAQIIRTALPAFQHLPDKATFTNGG